MPRSYQLTANIGRTRFDRLFHIGTCSTVIGLDALKAGVQEAKHGIDVQRYELAVAALARESPEDEDAFVDKEWVERVQKQNAAETSRLEQELKGYKNNLIKESIRVWCLRRDIQRSSFLTLRRWAMKT